MGGVRTKRAFAALLLAATLAVVGAGCGDSSDDAAPGPNSSFTSYEIAMQKLDRSLGNALRTAGTANRNASDAVIVKNLRKSQTDLRAAAIKLEKITPPDRVKAQHLALVKGVRLFAGELDGVIKNVKNGGGVGALATINTLPGITQMGRASAKIAKAGYVICLNC
jgi:hypothetical protein